jgi:hypothetical protein
VNPLLNVIPGLALIGAMIWGFKLAGKKTTSVPLQMLLGFILGCGIIVGIMCVLFGVMFAGCLIMGSPSFR